MADILKTERTMLKYRLLAVLAVGLAHLAAGEGANAWWVVGLSIGYLIYALSLPGLVARLPSAVFLMIAVDALYLGLLFSAGGAVTSLVVMLLPLLVVFYAAYGAYRTAFVAATAMLVSLFMAQSIGGRLPAYGPFLAQIPLFYLLAALSGYLADGRIRRLDDQERLQRLLQLELTARSLGGAVRTIQEASDVGAMLQDMTEAAPSLTGLPQCLVSLLDRKSGWMVARASTSRPSDFAVDRFDVLMDWPQEGSLLADVLAARQPIALRRPADDVLLPLWARRVGAEAILAVPCLSRGVDVGVVYFYGVPAGYAFTARDVDRAQAFAGVVAQVAVNAQLYEDAQVTVASVINDLHPVVLPKTQRRDRSLPVIEVGDLSVDIPNHQARINGKSIGLTPTEFDLLSVLAQSTGRAVDQDSLLRRVWGETYRGRSTVVDVGVHRLRRKIEDGAGAPRRIITVRGAGYMLVPGRPLANQIDRT